ncbi:hypothetical protein IQ07DRAFT_188808 [Pyrenochaeta sp. DS3sAY3a]|nr:hypothetical protein IQ07DRAFT_188808 [Pyrenochaeta sp. DS3sAY3a]
MCNSTPELSDSTRRDASNSTCQVHRSSQLAAAIPCTVYVADNYQKGVLLLCLSSCLATAALPAPLSSAHIHRWPLHTRHPIPHVAHPAVIVAGVTPAQSLSGSTISQAVVHRVLLLSFPPGVQQPGYSSLPYSTPYTRTSCHRGDKRHAALPCLAERCWDNHRPRTVKHPPSQ